MKLPLPSRKRSRRAISGKWLVANIPRGKDAGLAGYDDVPDERGPDDRPIPFSRFLKDREGGDGRSPA